MVREGGTDVGGREQMREGGCEGGRRCAGARGGVFMEGGRGGEIGLE